MRNRILILTAALLLALPGIAAAELSADEFVEFVESSPAGTLRDNAYQTFGIAHTSATWAYGRAMIDYSIANDSVGMEYLQETCIRKNMVGKYSDMYFQFRAWLADHNDEVRGSSISLVIAGWVRTRCNTALTDAYGPFEDESAKPGANITRGNNGE